MLKLFKILLLTFVIQKIAAEYEEIILTYKPSTYAYSYTVPSIILEKNSSSNVTKNLIKPLEFQKRENDNSSWFQRLGLKPIKQVFQGASAVFEGFKEEKKVNNRVHPHRCIWKICSRPLKNSSNDMFISYYRTIKAKIHKGK